MTKQEFMAFSLPYGIKIQLDSKEIVVYNATTYFYDKFNSFSKPILHPLSDLTKPIEHNGKKFVPLKIITESECEIIISKYSCDSEKIKTISITYKLMGETFTDFIINRNSVDYTDFKYVQKLIEWKFDIAELIDNGEAIDINTLETNPYK